MQTSDESILSESMKTCSKCAHIWPIGEFRLRCADTGKRHSECRDCYNLYQRSRRRRIREREIGRFAAKVHAAKDQPHVMENVVAAMVDRLGGLASFVDLWAGLVNKALAEGNVSLGLRNLQAVAELLAVIAPKIEAKRARES